MTVTIQHILDQLKTPYFKEMADCSYDEIIKDAARLDEAAKTVQADFQKFVRYGKNQKQWWRAPIIEHAGGDVHHLWLDGVLTEVVSSADTTLLYGRNLRVTQEVICESKALVGMLFSCVDIGYHFVSWKYLFWLTGVPGDAKARPLRHSNSKIINN